MRRPEPSLEYLAGLFDGEGCISISRNQQTHSKRGPSPVHTLTVTVAMNQPGVAVKAFHRRYGGSIRLRKPQGKSNRPIYCWYASSRIALRVLEDLGEHLLVKKRQAQLGVKFQRRVLRTKRYGPVAMPVAEIRARDEMWRSMSQLNRPRTRR